MSTSKKTPESDRHGGGPGSSHQTPEKPAHREKGHTQPGAPTNPSRSQVSGGGGERDRHHTHDEGRK
jgi:hypothetical protein